MRIGVHTAEANGAGADYMGASTARVCAALARGVEMSHSRRRRDLPLVDDARLEYAPHAG